MHPDQADDPLAGALLGLALGDALGFAAEARGAAAGRAAAERVQPGAMIAARPPHGAGQVSDDTQSALALLESMADGDWDPARFGRTIARVALAPGAVGFGPGTQGAAARLQLGVPWEQAGAPAPYAGNGAAMRVAPAAVAYRGAPALLRRMADEQARVTHQGPVPRAMAVAVAIVAAGAAGRGADGTWIAPVLAEARAAATAIGPVGPAFDWLAAALEVDAAEALQRLHAAGLDPDPAAGPVHGLSAHAVASVSWALRAALGREAAPLAALRTALTPGGDADTMAAIAGAITGARFGAEAWPADLLVQLHDGGVPLAPRCLTLAARLARLTGSIA